MVGCASTCLKLYILFFPLGVQLASKNNNNNNSNKMLKYLNNMQTCTDFESKVSILHFYRKLIAIMLSSTFYQCNTRWVRFMSLQSWFNLCHRQSGWPQSMVGKVVWEKVVWGKAVWGKARQGTSLCCLEVRKHLLGKRSQGSQPGALDLLTPTSPVLKMEAAHQDRSANISAWSHTCTHVIIGRQYLPPWIHSYNWEEAIENVKFKYWVKPVCAGWIAIALVNMGMLH